MQNMPPRPSEDDAPWTLLIHQDFRKYYPQYLMSSAWERVRRQVLARDGHLCRVCRKSANEVHHLNYGTVGNESLEDIISLCRSCHAREHQDSTI